MVEALDTLAEQKQVNRTALLNQAILEYLASARQAKKTKRILGILRGPTLPEDFTTMASDQIRSLFEGTEE